MSRSLQTYRYGEGAAVDAFRIGVARHLPRGVRKTDYATRGYFDLWLPILAPSPELVARYRGDDIDFKAFARDYKREMSKAEPRSVIELLARLAGHQAIALGCFCKDAERCHRSLLAPLLAKLIHDLEPENDRSSEHKRVSLRSPPCYLGDSTEFREEFR